MTKNLLNQEEMERLRKLKGEIRGSAIKEDARYILEKKGEEGVKILEEELKKIGLPIEYKKIRTTRWYPLSLRVISLLVIKKVFNFSNEDVFEMGKSAPKYAFFFAKLATLPFVSLKEAVKTYPPRIWKGHYTIGEIQNIEFSAEKKYMVMRIKDFEIHPILCTFLAGYMVGLSSFVIKSKKIDIKETKCPFKGDICHEFIIWWE